MNSAAALTVPSNTVCIKSVHCLKPSGSCKLAGRALDGVPVVSCELARRVMDGVLLYAVSCRTCAGRYPVAFCELAKDVLEGVLLYHVSL